MGVGKDNLTSWRKSFEIMKRCPTATPTYRNPTTVQRHCPCCWLLKNLHTWGGGSWELSLEISPGLIPTECIFVINCLIPVSDVFEWRNKYRSIAMQVESTQGVQSRNWSLTKRTSQQQQQSREMVATTNNASRRLILKLKYWGLYNSFTGDWTDGTYTHSFCLPGQKIIFHRLSGPAAATVTQTHQPQQNTSFSFWIKEGGQSATFQLLRCFVFRYGCRTRVFTFYGMSHRIFIKYICSLGLWIEEVETYRCMSSFGLCKIFQNLLFA